ncbi:hypothetical protein HYC85_019600 [Camellia sinensis]|uniref:Ribosomal protein L17 n=1 Tax=Camellia sinensis TaxID=4442 RepID=A0A7J7GRC0_CAMSI|nr:hypothetical protein HYC85_019600 [Camellia sinensis]
MRKLNRPTGHRMSILRTMVSQLVKHERIETTVAKAKEIRCLDGNMNPDLDLTILRSYDPFEYNRSGSIVESRSESDPIRFNLQALFCIDLTTLDPILRSDPINTSNDPTVLFVLQGMLLPLCREMMSFISYLQNWLIDTSESRTSLLPRWNRWIHKTAPNSDTSSWIERMSSDRQNHQPPNHHRDHLWIPERNPSLAGNLHPQKRIKVMNLMLEICS